MTDEQQPSEETYVPPSQLPPPLPDESGMPLNGMVAGVTVAILAGAALFVASQIFYIYIVYNVLIGMAIGKAVALAPKRSRYTNVPALLTFTLICSLLAYLCFNIALFMYALHQLNAPPAAGAVDWIHYFFGFLVGRAQHEPFIHGAEIGAVGNAIVWLVELAITFYCAWGRVRVAINVSHAESVPTDVVEFVLEMQAQGNDDDTIAQELSMRGWSDPRDQEQAYRAAASLVSLVQESSEEEEI
jgi:hypothetical protein